jgi:hypothetical protein
MKTAPLAAILLLLIITAPAHADLDVLVLGSSQSFDGSEQVFSAQAVADELRSILEGDASVGTVNVVFDDIYTNKTIDTAVGGGASSWILLRAPGATSAKRFRLMVLTPGPGLPWTRSSTGLR